MKEGDRMASRFFPCICGRFATIDMCSWITGLRMIECCCGRKLKVGGMSEAKHNWQRYMRIEQALRKVGDRKRMINDE